MATKEHNPRIDGSYVARVYGGTAFPLGSRIDLTAVPGSGGKCCRQIIMLEAGTLAVEDADGSTTNSIFDEAIPAGTVINFSAQAISNTQMAKILVIW